MIIDNGRVVVGVDGSPQSLGALRWAADEAVRYTRQLHVVHACRGGNAHQNVALDAAAEAWRWLPGVDTVASTDAGEPATVLRRYSAHARLVVVASAGTGTGGQAPLGTVGDALGRQAGCPVLLVHDALRWAAPDAVLPRDGPVVVGFDGTEPAHRALRLAFEEAAGRDVRLVTIQAWQHPDLWRGGGQHGVDLTDDVNNVHERLRRAAEPWQQRFPNIEVELRAQSGDPTEVLISASQWALMLVLGVHGSTKEASTPASPVTWRTLRSAACPVLLAHKPAPGRPFSSRPIQADRRAARSFR